MEKTSLPVTYYDVVMEHQWPRFRQAIRSDLGTLRAAGTVGPIETVDAFQSAMMQAAQADIRDFGAEAGRRIGVDAETALSLLAQHQPGQLESFINAYSFAYHFVLNFELASRKTFFFRDGLVERLLATEIASDSDLVRLPFKTCQFVFTSPAAIQAVALMVVPDAVSMPLAYDMPITVFVTELDAPQYQGRSVIMLVVQASPGETRTMLKRQLLLAPGRSLAHALHTDWAEIRDHNGLTEDARGKRIIDGGAEVAEVTDEPFYTDGLLIFRLVLNAILYLSSDSAEVAEQVGRRTVSPRSMNHAARRAAKRQSRLPYASVGDSVRPIYIDPAFRAAEQESTPSTGLHRLRHRLLVRGHWKQQPHGPKLSQRKLIWIEPYIRGPDMAELFNRPYVVQ